MLGSQPLVGCGWVSRRKARKHRTPRVRQSTACWLQLGSSAGPTAWDAAPAQARGYGVGAPSGKTVNRLLAAAGQVRAAYRVGSRICPDEGVQSLIWLRRPFILDSGIFRGCLNSVKFADVLDEWSLLGLFISTCVKDYNSIKTR